MPAELFGAGLILAALLFAARIAPRMVNRHRDGRPLASMARPHVRITGRRPYDWSREAQED